MANWYYEFNGAQHGPVAAAAAVTLLSNGTLSARSLVWREGLADWVPLQQSELACYLAAAGAAPPPFLGAGAAASVNPYQPPQAMASEPLFPSEPGLELTWKQILWSFEGRIPRRTYWAGIGIWLAIIMVVGLITAVLAHAQAPTELMLLFLPLAVAYIWSALALQIKRWHDRNRPGAMVLINLIPYIGGIWAFVECGCLRGTVGTNSYGHDPT